MSFWRTDDFLGIRGEVQQQQELVVRAQMISSTDDDDGKSSESNGCLCFLQHFFASFLSRDEAYRLIINGWSQHSGYARIFLGSHYSPMSVRDHDSPRFFVFCVDNFSNAFFLLESVLQGYFRC